MSEITDSIDFETIRGLQESSKEIFEAEVGLDVKKAFFNGAVSTALYELMDHSVRIEEIPELGSESPPPISRCKFKPNHNRNHYPVISARDYVDERSYIVIDDEEHPQAVQGKIAGIGIAEGGLVLKPRLSFIKGNYWARLFDESGEPLVRVTLLDKAD